MRYAFIGDATYALMLYLLYATDEMLQNTTFFVGNNCGACNLEKKIIMSPICPFTNKELIKYRIKCLKYRKQLKEAEIFAQDHVFFAPALIDNLPYNVIEDCPNFFSIREERKEITFKPTFSALWYNFKVGRIYQRYAGHNPWCRKRIISSTKDEELFIEKSLPYERISLVELWHNAPDSKRNLISKAFSLPPLNSIKKDIVIFSQPLQEDAHLQDEEIRNIFLPFVEKFGSDNILVKLHPRDRYDYKKAFPGISTLVTKAPQQLLDIMGVRFKTAITVCSSAVSSLNEDCDIIWLGAEIDERIVKAYGNIKNPRQ